MKVCPKCNNLMTWYLTYNCGVPTGGYHCYCCGYDTRYENQYYTYTTTTGTGDISDVDIDHTAKHDEGKLQIHLVPPQIIRDIAEVRMYGNKKYKDPDNWKTVEKWRYVDALLRHLLAYLEDSDSIDEESGIPHYKHAACNMAFICAMEEKNKEEIKK